MGFRTGAYAKVWEVKVPENNGNYLDARISISKKNSKTNEYETDFSSYVRFIGAAAQKAKDFGNTEHTIKIGDCDVSNRYVKERNTTYTNYAIFDFEDVTNNRSTNSNNKGTKNSKPLTASSSPTDPSEFIDIPDGVDEELPFN